jgi:hypothetical protein
VTLRSGEKQTKVTYVEDAILVFIVSNTGRNAMVAVDRIELPTYGL